MFDHLVLSQVSFHSGITNLDVIQEPCRSISGILSHFAGLSYLNKQGSDWKIQPLTQLTSNIPTNCGCTLMAEEGSGRLLHPHRQDNQKMIATTTLFWWLLWAIGWWRQQQQLYNHWLTPVGNQIIQSTFIRFQHFKSNNLIIYHEYVSLSSAEVLDPLCNLHPSSERIARVLFAPCLYIKVCWISSYSNVFREKQLL